jgi:hypothetical protein
MGDVMLALARTFASLKDGKVWLYVLTPALLSLLLSIGLAIWALGAVVQQMMAYPPMTLLVGWGLVWLAHLPGLPGRLAGDLRRRLPDGLAARRHRHHAADAQAPVGNRVSRRRGDGQGQLRRGGGQQRAGLADCSSSAGWRDDSAVADPRLLAGDAAAADGLAEPSHLRLRRPVNARHGRRVAGNPPRPAKRRCSCSA